MARKKTITQDQILTATYELVAKEGLSKFTARNIAAKMKCSTQPIYLEFKNMEDLRLALIQKIFDHLKEEVLPKVQTGNPVIDFCLNYIDFVTKENHLYHTLFIIGHGGEPVLQGFSFEYFKHSVIKDTDYEKLPEGEIENLFVNLLTIASGVSSLMYSGVIAPNSQQIASILNDVLKAAQERKITYDLNFITSSK